MFLLLTFLEKWFNPIKQDMMYLSCFKTPFSSYHLIVQSQERKLQNNVWNQLKVNN